VYVSMRPPDGRDHTDPGSVWQRHRATHLSSCMGSRGTIARGAHEENRQYKVGRPMNGPTRAGGLVSTALDTVLRAITLAIWLGLSPCRWVGCSGVTGARSQRLTWSRRAADEGEGRRLSRRETAPRFRGGLVARRHRAAGLPSNRPIAVR
jgi:hypothetical protein